MISVGSGPWELIPGHVVPSPEVSVQRKGDPECDRLIEEVAGARALGLVDLHLKDNCLLCLRTG